MLKGTRWKTLSILLFSTLSGCSALAPIAADVAAGALTDNGGISANAQVGEEANQQIVGNQEKIEIDDVAGNNVIDQKKQIANDIIADNVSMVTMPTWLVIAALLFAWFPNYSTLKDSILEFIYAKKEMVPQETKPLKRDTLRLNVRETTT